mgnify:CR=1 FL=1
MDNIDIYESNRLLSAKALLDSWGRAQRRELRGLCRGYSSDNRYGQRIPGRDCMRITDNDIEFVAKILKEIFRRDERQYTVLFLYYEKRLHINPICKRLGASKPTILRLKGEGEHYLAGRIPES